MINIAIVGNPNSGKTTIFNYLTGKNERVGNWMGVTVEAKTGKLRRRLNKTNKKISIIDLPGTYTMDGYTKDEIIAIDYIKSHQIDGILNVIDIGQLERSLVFTLELIQLNKPIVIALNKYDIAQKEDMDIDVIKLEEVLNQKIIYTQALRKKGLENVLNHLLDKVGI